MKQLLVLSGKGGTGKTTVSSALIQLSKAKAFADCDVDAPNLHLVMTRSDLPQRTSYYGMPKAVIDPDKCTDCGLCAQHCRFEAISRTPVWQVDPFACEGCSVCAWICPEKAITMNPAVAGELSLFTEDVVFSTAKLKMGSGTSGKLVTEVKKQMKQAAGEVDLAIIDGSPGIGCPVIASISGVDLVLAVAEPSVSGLSDLKRILDTARQFQTSVAVCINKADTNPGLTQEIIILCDTLKLPFVGSIPFDSTVVEATNQGRSIIEYDCPSASAIKAVYEQTMKVFLGDHGHQQNLPIIPIVK